MNANQVARRIREVYASRTELSRAHDMTARHYLPGGDTRTAVYYQPYPIYLAEGDGCLVYDYDGNQYLDFLNNYTSLIHGHCHPAIVAAVRSQLTSGTVFGAPAVGQYELAELICQRIPSVESLRFANSGTEATMMAMRAARAFTGKDVILKMDGGYHGTHDFAEVSITPELDPRVPPSPRLERPGVPACVLDASMVVPFNDLDAVEEALAAHGDRIAAVIVEPVLNAGGLVPSRPGYLQGLRCLVDKTGALLVFDEVVTFRLSPGGAQLSEGVEPDLTALGKIIGGGFPVGAFGGKREIMERFDPAHPKTIGHSGTFNGNDITMAAGKAALENYGEGEIDRINALGSRLRAGFDAVFRDNGIKGHATGQGSLAYVHWTDREVVTARDSALGIQQAAELPALLHMEMLNRGLFAASRGEFCVSTPMTESEIDQAIEIFDASLQVLRPYVAEVTDYLLAS